MLHIIHQHSPCRPAQPGGLQEKHGASPAVDYLTHSENAYGGSCVGRFLKREKCFGNYCPPARREGGSFGRSWFFMRLYQYTQAAGTLAVRRLKRVNVAATEHCGNVSLSKPWGELRYAGWKTQSQGGYSTPRCGGLEVGRHGRRLYQKKMQTRCLRFFLPLCPRLRLWAAPLPLRR